MLRALTLRRRAYPPCSPQGQILEPESQRRSVRRSDWGVRLSAAQHGNETHIVSRGQERQSKLLIPGYRARRWVVERTHSR